jgi:nitroreductase
MTFKEGVSKLLPRRIFWYVRSVYQFAILIRSYMYDFSIYWRHSYSRMAPDSSIKLESAIILRYHVLEKGLTMPETRLGFGRDKVMATCQYCDVYIRKYGIDSSEQVKNAVGVLIEYMEFHSERNFKLDTELIERILKTVKLAEEGNIKPTKQVELTRDSYFQHSDSSFGLFSRSRRSVRNYSVLDVPVELLKEAIELSTSTPSACNRQTSRVYIYTDPDDINKILDLQGGSRGFGHLTNKLLLVTAELGVWGGAHERNQAYIDGGMHAMNLLYALHHKKIACCILNCSHTASKDKRLRKVTAINDSETFIAMISCGNAPPEFSVAKSLRNHVELMCEVR